MGEVCEILFVNQNMFSVAASEQGLEPKKSLKQSREIEDSMATSIGGKSRYSNPWQYCKGKQMVHLSTYVK